MASSCRRVTAAVPNLPSQGVEGTPCLVASCPGALLSEGRQKEAGPVSMSVVTILCRHFQKAKGTRDVKFFGEAGGPTAHEVLRGVLCRRIVRDSERQFSRIRLLHLGAAGTACSAGARIPQHGAVPGISGALGAAHTHGLYDHGVPSMEPDRSHRGCSPQRSGLSHSAHGKSPYAPSRVTARRSARN